MRIFLVEDDIALSVGIEYSLKQEGYEVSTASTYKKALDWILSDSDKSEYIVLLDVMLPDGNGFDLLNELRSNCGEIPVIFLTAVSDEVNVVQGLELGADDYISKPFRVKELVSRIKAVSRRYNIGKSFIKYENIEIDCATATTYLVENDEKIKLDLTTTEYRLLNYFLSNQGIVLERNAILDKIFDSRGNYVDNNTLSVYVKRLREKIGDMDREEPYIKTVRGIGYIVEKK